MCINQHRFVDPHASFPYIDKSTTSRLYVLIYAHGRTCSTRACLRVLYRTRRRGQYIQLLNVWYCNKTLFAGVITTTMTSARNSIYSTHSVADAHLLAILDDKYDDRQLNTQTSRLSALLPTKFLETVLILPGTSSRRYEDSTGYRQTSFDDMQKSV
jgi:hypothetical protein